MSVIAVVNRKGGSGKSTLATHLAACLASRGLGVMLGDVDRQPSTSAWLRRRATYNLRSAAIVGRSVDLRSVLRTPPGVSHTVLDTPGGLHGFELARTVMLADAILMPVCHSAFDRESSAACLAELRRHPRVAVGRCKVAAVGMRIDMRTRGERELREWAQALDLPFLGVLRESQTYVRCVERGLSIFDMPASRVQIDLDQWQAITTWLTDTLNERTAQDPPATGLRVARPATSKAQANPLPPSATTAPQAPPKSAGGLRKLWAWLLPPRTTLPPTRS